MAALTFGTDPADDLKKQFAALLMKQGADTSPVQHWTQGAARMANALVGGLAMKDASNKAKAEDAVIAKILMGGQPQAQPPAMPQASSQPPQASAPMAGGAKEALWSSPGANGWNVQDVNGQRVAVNNTPDTGATSSIPSPLDPPDPKTMRLAAALVQSEAGNQGPQGQQAVANTLRNRAADSGMTIPQIISQKGQFEPVGTGKINQFGPGTPGYDSAVAATERAYTGNDPTRGAVNFYAPKAQAQATDGRSPVARFDNGAGIDIQDQRYFTRANTGSGSTDFTAQSRQPQVPTSPALRATSAIPPEVQAQINSLIEHGGSRGKAMALQLWSKYQAPTNPTDDMREYAAAQQQGFKGTLFDFITTKKQAGAIQNQVMIDQKGESEFSKQAGGLQAKRFDELVSDAPAAKQMVADVEMLRDLGGKIETGKIAEAKAAIGPYAQALGIDVKNLSEIQAYEAIVNRVAPNLRVKGSGAQSDYELRNFLKSIPSLGNTPEGNEIVARTLQGLQQNKIKAAEIASRALSGEISRSDAERQIRDLPDPMQDWRKLNKAGSQSKPSGTTSNGVGWSIQ